MSPCVARVCVFSAVILGLLPVGVNGQTVSVRATPPPSGSGETLKFPYTCSGAQLAPEWYCYSADLFIYVDDSRVNSDQKWGCGDQYLSTMIEVQAKEETQRITCTLHGPGGSATDSLNQEGSGPNILNVLISAFIPYEYIRVPFDPGEPLSTQLAEGDNRSFQVFGATARQSTAIDLMNPAYNADSILSGPHHATGLSVEYDAPTSLSHPQRLQDLAPSGGWILPSAYDDWSWGGEQKLYWAFAGTENMWCSPPERLGQSQATGTASLRLRCSGASYYPFHSFSPAIDWDLTFLFIFGYSQVQYSVSGCRDGFPAYEAYGNTRAMMNHFDNGSPSSLFPPCDTAVFEDGVIR